MTLNVEKLLFKKDIVSTVLKCIAASCIVLTTTCPRNTEKQELVNEDKSISLPNLRFMPLINLPWL